jgi:hypothetical protein
MKHSLILVLLLIGMLCLNAFPCSANSAQPPSILIIVPNAPADLVISLGPDIVKAQRTDRSFESYFTFYTFALKNPENNNKLIIKITSGGESFEIISDSPLKSYNNIFTLDLKNRALTPGKSLSRSAILVSLRLFFTLVLEALVFFLFGYRSKKSWLIFLIINLVTQGLLYIILDSSNSPLNSYVLFPLIGGEILVLVVEIIAFSFLIGEHSRLRTVLYVILANLLSLVLGGYLIMVLPV